MSSGQENNGTSPPEELDNTVLKFAEAIITVANAARRSAEGKTSAQAEAAEWKQKYEQERSMNMLLQHKVSSGHHYSALPNKRTTDLSDQQKVCLPANGKNGHCCGANGICKHDMLQDGELASTSESLNNKMVKKASFKLSWDSEGTKGNQYKHDIVSFERGNISTTERSSRQISLKWYGNPQTVLVLTKPNSTSVQLLCSEIIRWLKEQKRLDIYVEERVRTELIQDSSYFKFVHTWKDDEVSLLHTKVDLVVTLGGDGTVLWAASLFKGPVPLVVPISMGSLGFMTAFQRENYEESLNSVLKGPVSIILRHRLQCHVIRKMAKHEYMSSKGTILTDYEHTEGPFLVLNEVTIDRGISSYLTNLECYCDGIPMTCVQGDGLIISTTSGSTAYSLGAGGSMVHPQVPGILFTPICPHSLSFRPLILPEHITVKVKVPLNSRGSAWASFDGKYRQELCAGDELICSMAPWPVPTACLSDSISDFLRSIHENLHWNQRKIQNSDSLTDLNG